MAVSGLEKIIGRITEDANAEAARILAAAEEECRVILAEAEEAAEAGRRRIMAEAEAQGVSWIERSKSASDNQRRNQLLRTRAELLDEVFAGTQSGLQANAEGYLDFLTKLLAAALSEQARVEREGPELYGEEELELPDSYELILNPAERERYGEALLAAICKNYADKLPRKMTEQLSLGSARADIEGGFVLRCRDTELNCRLSALFSEVRREVEGEVCRILFAADRRA